MSNIVKVGIACLGIIFLFTYCKKEDPDDGWESCLECNIVSWTGSFSGSAEYKDLSSGNTVGGLVVTILITETSENYLQVKVNVPNYYATTLYGTYVGTYSISLASSNYSFSGNLQKKDNTLRLVGDSKYFVEKVDELITEEIVLFEALKQLN